MRDDLMAKRMTSDQHEFWKDLAGRAMRFLAVGGFATILMYLLLVMAIEWLHFNPVVASVAAYLISAIVNYWLNHRLTFRSTQRHRVAALRFSVVVACGLMLNTLIMYLGTEHGSWHYLPTQIVATGCVLIWNFVGSQWWTFRSSPQR